jgi:hypothetical protein
MSVNTSEKVCADDLFSFLKVFWETISTYSLHISDLKLVFIASLFFRVDHKSSLQKINWNQSIKLILCQVNDLIKLLLIKLFL